MLIFESAFGELFFYIITCIWFNVMPKRAIFMAVIAYFGSQNMLLPDTLLLWCGLMAFTSLTNRKFGLAFLVGFGLGSGQIQDWLKRRIL